MPESVCARTRKASHIGAEQNHLWPVISYSPPGPPPLSGVAAVVLARTSEPPCFSVIAIPQSAPLFSGGRREALVVGEREQPLLPFLGELRLGPERRDRRVGHRDRAADPALGLGQLHEQRRPGDVGAGPGLAPGHRVQAVGDADRHQLMPGAVEDDLVDPVAEAIMGAQLGALLVGLETEADHPRRAAQLAQLADPVLRPAAALAPQRLDQGTILLEAVEVLERRGLVGDRVGRPRAALLDRGHGGILRPPGERGYDRGDGGSRREPRPHPPLRRSRQEGPEAARSADERADLRRGRRDRDRRPDRGRLLPDRRWKCPGEHRGRDDPHPRYRAITSGRSP